MKERHPIDDLFREGLYNSEAEPPADVWERVVARRSWTHRLLAGLERQWAIGLLAIFLVGSPLAWYAMGSHPEELAREVETSTAIADEQVPTTSSYETTTKETASIGSGPIDPNGELSSYVGEPASVQTGGGSTTPSTTSTSSHRGASTSPDRLASDPLKTSPSSDKDDASLAGAQTPAATKLDARKQMDAASEHVADRVSTSLVQGSVEGASTLRAANVSEASGRPRSAVGEDYFDETFVLEHARGIVYERLPDSALLSNRPIEVPYVLANGAWWIGLQFGWNQWSGGWKGISPLREEMDQAETWQGGWHGGVVGGRTWKSGFSVSLGADLSSVKSRFLFNERIEETSDSVGAMMLDTTWTVNAIAPDSSYVVYSYDIALVPVPIGEREMRFSATNRYTLLSIPVELAWQKNVKRFTFAPRLGVSANFFLGRKGNSLVMNASDGRVVAVPMDDARVQDRFAVLLMGSAGADVGYAMDERTQLFVGGAYSSALTGLGDADLRPAMQGTQLRLRLVREFGMKQRKPR